MTRRRWLSDAEQLTWRRYQAMSKTLESALDRQLQRDADMPHGYYTILARLSVAPGRSARITALAEATENSQSRVSHAISALERRGWVRREKCTDDTRGTIAVLTAAGQRALDDAAPAHVALVRATVFDVLSVEQIEQFGTLCLQVLEGLDPAWTDPVTQSSSPTGVRSTGQRSRASRSEQVDLPSRVAHLGVPLTTVTAQGPVAAPVA